MKCRDCTHSRPVDVKEARVLNGFLHCSHGPIHRYLSATLAKCVFNPSRFAEKKK